MENDHNIKRAVINRRSQLFDHLAQIPDLSRVDHPVVLPLFHTSGTVLVDNIVRIKAEDGDDTVGIPQQTNPGVLKRFVPEQGRSICKLRCEMLHETLPRPRRLLLQNARCPQNIMISRNRQDASDLRLRIKSICPRNRIGHDVSARPVSLCVDCPLPYFAASPLTVFLRVNNIAGHDYTVNALCGRICLPRF
jgi:hypothetical protein